MDGRKATAGFDTPTPGCACSHCRALKELKADGAPNGKEQMGRTQRYARELGWADHGDGSERNSYYLTPAERADREERETTGKCLRATYYHLLGERPNCQVGDRQTAKLYLLRIEAAIEHGGWTRSEATRLRKMKAKWKARAEGNDPRFNIVGNRIGGLTPPEASMVKHRKLIQGMKEILDKSGRSNGD